MTDPPESEAQRGDSEAPVPRPEPIVVDPASQRELGTVSQYFAASFVSGPLPSARELAGYEQVSTGLSETIVTEWRMETSHRRRMEQFALTSQVTAQRRGQMFGLVIAVAVIGAGVALAFAGKTAAGLVALIAPLATLAAVFVYSQIREPSAARESRQEPRERGE